LGKRKKKGRYIRIRLRQLIAGGDAGAHLDRLLEIELAWDRGYSPTRSDRDYINNLFWNIKRLKERRCPPPEPKAPIDARRKEYNEYINSPKWQAIRQKKLIESGRICSECGTAKGKFHVHHLTYKRFKKEELRDLAVLCKPCHMAHHERS